MSTGKPINSCRQNSCDSCRIHTEVTCHLTFKKLISYWLFVLPALLTGAIALLRNSHNLFICWALLTGLFFLLFGIRVLCTHCPHYNRSSRIMKCWANYGLPKLWRYRPEPINKAEKTILISGFFLVFGYPAIFILLFENPGILILYLFTVAMFFILMRKFNCSRCINFSCPFNGVKESVKEEFRRYNPLID